MLKGIQLTLLMGSGLGTPPPAPKILIDSLLSVQITNSRDQSGFQLSFTVGKNSPIMTTLMPRGFFRPITTRVIIVVTLNGRPKVLMDGLVTNQELAPASQAGASTLTITGGDLTVAMDLIQNIIPFPAMPDIAKVALRLAPYASLGIIPLIIPTSVQIVKMPTEGFESQAKETDKSYIQSLAQENGCVFYLRPGPTPGRSIAYFGPDINIPKVQSALSVNLDVHTNVDSISFSLDGLANSVYIYTVMDPILKKIPIPIPIPDINPLRPPISARPSMPWKVEFGGLLPKTKKQKAAETGKDEKEGAAKKTPAEVAKDIIARLLDSDNKSVTASGSLDVLRYGKILNISTLVAVRGASLSYDGLYYVDSVTHDIKPGSYKQNFSLSRNGLMPLSNSVPL